MQDTVPSLPKLSVWERCVLTLSLIPLPLVVLCNFLTSPLSPRNKGKTNARVVFDSTARYVLARCDIRQLQHVSGTTYAAYTSWLKQSKAPAVVEKLDNGARLLWVGAKRTDRVVIYCHGGGFVGPLSDFQCAFWARVQEQLFSKHNGQFIGVAVLEYSLWPAAFPSQLTQLMAAVSHVFASGVHPSNLYLAGDSAGANLILQLVSHSLHPLTISPSVSTSPLSLDDSHPIGGIILVSPWISLTCDGGSFKANSDLDIIPAWRLASWGTAYLAPISPSQHPYVQVLTPASPETWLSGIQNLVQRVFITAGGNEGLRDDVVHLSETLKKVHKDVRIEVQPGAVHADPIFDVAAKSKGLSYVTGMITDWLAEGNGRPGF
ncbi:alpha beta-hydrolase [Leucogyrophana mollusca]|uniref:Alpha beta-hydrolase n=1 Tax=Leucogyrophana mollusca TaxID=85980 RepID=A0ACB8AY10_9AGAM|nr:alpha beta-hydrolase [Leucogyrophana mollusca]